MQIPSILFMLLVIITLAACSDGSPQQSPRVLVEDNTTPLASQSPIPSAPLPTNSPVPTAYQWWPTTFPDATPRQVTVSRVSDSVDPRQDLLLAQGEAIPAIVLTDIDGQIYQLGDLSGRGILINFWTVGCGSCFYEFPLLQQVRDTFNEDELLILAVNVSDLAEETRALAQGLGATYPMVVDPDADIFQGYFGGVVVPTTYFIHPDGTVLDAIEGPMDATILNSYLTQMGLDPIPTD